MTDSRKDNPDDCADQAWLQKTLASLDTQEQSIDYVTRTKLSAARARALDAGSRFEWFSARTAAAAVSLSVGAVVLVNLSPDTPESTPLMASQDLPILSSSEELEFYQSLEFLEWMDDSYPDSTTKLQG